MAVVDTKGKTVTTGSVRTRSSEAAEETAIALAVINGRKQDRTIISDSKTAIRNFTKGWVSSEAAKILNRRAEDFRNGQITPKYLKWIPAHMGEVNTEDPSIPPNLNEKAHRTARDLTHRGSVSDGPTPLIHPGRRYDCGGGDGEDGGGDNDEVAIQDDRDRLITYHDILAHYKQQREEYPPPHKQLDRSQETDWRRLQTRTFPNPVHLNRVNSRQYPEASCMLCKHEHADMAHILWKCTRISTIYKDDNIGPDLLEERWLSALTSSDLQEQLWAIQRARAAVERLCLTAHNARVA